MLAFKKEMRKMNVLRHPPFHLMLALVASSPAYADSYVQATIDGNSQLHVLSSDGQEVALPKEPGQVGFQSPKISEDGKVIGWLTLYLNCCTSYPIPLSLVLFSGGKVIHTFKGNELPIWEWNFYAHGTRVAYWQTPTHGNYEPYFELRNVSTGELIQAYDGNSGEQAPIWVNQLFPNIGGH